MDLFPVCVCACAHVRVYNIIHVKLAKLYSKLNKVKVGRVCYDCTISYRQYLQLPAAWHACSVCIK